MATDDIVNVPVPRAKLTEVYRVLAGGDNTIASTVRDDDAAVPVKDQERDDDWIEEDFIDILRDRRPSFERVAMMLDELTKKPGVPLSLTDLAKATGLRDSELKGALSGFGRSMAATWGYPCAPWVKTWIADEFHYSVTDQVAATWRASRRS